MTSCRTTPAWPGEAPPQPITEIAKAASASPSDAAGTVLPGGRLTTTGQHGGGGSGAGRGM
jgi:hypothetical protein